MASLRSRYTLLIPTFNRPAHLRSLLGYLSARRLEYPIRVLDSSSGDALSQNRQTVSRTALDIVHDIYDAAIPVHKKIGLAVASVESTYCSLCADDDVLFTDELNALLDVLDADPRLVIAHGYYVNFKPGEDFDIWYTDYSAPSIVAEDALKRIVEQMSDYQAIFYGIHRTGTMQAIQPPVDRVKSLWAKELLTSTLALIAGGMYRAPRYYMARNTNPSIATEGWHPHQFFAMEPAELLREYADYRAVALEHLAADARCLRERRRDQHAPLLVRFGLRSARIEVPVHQASLFAERVEPGEPALDHAFPLRVGKAVETPVHTAGDDEAAGKRLAKLGR